MEGELWLGLFGSRFQLGTDDYRTFFPGDDPYWTAVDLHYWGTGDFERYDPSAITTVDGKLQITMTQEPMDGLNFKSGMYYPVSYASFFSH
jgi:beta-glucanase (GH16 family)